MAILLVILFAGFMATSNHMSVSRRSARAGHAPASTKKIIKIILWSLAGLVVIGLIAARLYLDTWLLNYVNNVLHNIKGYDGSAQSIQVDLYRGAYRIHNLVIKKKEG